VSARAVQWAFRSYTAIIPLGLPEQSQRRKKWCCRPVVCWFDEHHIYAHISHYFTNLNRGRGRRAVKLSLYGSTTKGKRQSGIFCQGGNTPHSQEGGLMRRCSHLLGTYTLARIHWLAHLLLRYKLKRAYRVHEAGWNRDMAPSTRIARRVRQQALDKLPPNCHTT